MKFTCFAGGNVLVGCAFTVALLYEQAQETGACGVEM